MNFDNTAEFSSYWILIGKCFEAFSYAMGCSTQIKNEMTFMGKKVNMVLDEKNIDDLWMQSGKERRSKSAIIRDAISEYCQVHQVEINHEIIESNNDGRENNEK